MRFEQDQPIIGTLPEREPGEHDLSYQFKVALALRRRETFRKLAGEAMKNSSGLMMLDLEKVSS